jgi:asparaginyl-tRNA synthetase
VAHRFGLVVAAKGGQAQRRGGEPMQRATIATIHEFEGQEVELCGWQFNRRGSKKICFMQMRDGSGFMQCVLARDAVDEALFDHVRKLPLESAVKVQGTVVADARSKRGFELQVTGVEVVHVGEEYPIGKKDHGPEFLMNNRHLWLRSRRQHVVLRVRHTVVKAIRDYFDERDFLLFDSPILTGNACEGTSTLFETPYFGDTAYLSQSGQLYQEAGAMAFGKTYCFGPTFRAEKSSTRRHLTEFWMVEPEMAYADNNDVMDLAEDFLCTVVERVLDKHAEELETILERDLTALRKVQKPFPRISYTEAIEHVARLRDAMTDPKERALMELPWGGDFGARHETELTQQYDRPIMVHDFPMAVKAFYFKRHPADPRLAACVDVLAPEGFGEIIGGGQREDDLDVLLKAIDEHQLDPKDFGWFNDLRRYGSVPHGGFGLGLERTVGWICGLHHVRETIPFARTMDRLRP